mmetsp:Transcript_22999/g.25627  ORF Transcript_22999/g.25627 Transcript_22999/m.25627 type:complete len:223 (+) Transcript_22999:68-736(+)
MSSAAAIRAAKTRCATTKALLRANIGVLRQKINLMTALRDTLGSKQANMRFAEVCPVVGASVGQHFRHSIDHIELVVNNVAKKKSKQDHGNYNDNRIRNINEIHYDIRIRGGDDETSMDAAEERILRVKRLIEESLSLQEIIEENNENVLACFMLSGDPTEGEFMLSSTIERELGFVAHHTIHHLAMVKIIATRTLKLLPVDRLPLDFGRAPSTIVYDKRTC